MLKHHGVWGVKSHDYGALKSGERGARNERGKLLFIMHVLSMAGIDDRNGITIDGISEVPFVGISHVIAFPTLYRRLASKKRALNVINGKQCIVDITHKVIVVIRVTIFPGHILIK